jgi:segregation and condensation protein B
MSNHDTDTEAKALAADDLREELADDTAVAEELSGDDTTVAEELSHDDTTVAEDLSPDDTAVAEELSGDDITVAEDLSPEPESADAPVVDAVATDAAVAPAPTAMPSAELRAVIEALIFASPEPITPKTLYKLLANESKDDVSAALNDLRLEYVNRPGLQIVEVAGGYQITTRAELHEWVRRLFHERSTQKLSVAALESLAVIAYRQPVTALEVTEIRGVNASGVLSTLLERNLIKIVGRKNVVGRPFMYGTTKEFLIRFGLKDLGDLPRIEDMADALGFDPPAGLIEQTPKDEMLPLDETEEGIPAPEKPAANQSDEPPDPEAS